MMPKILAGEKKKKFSCFSFPTNVLGWVNLDHNLKIW